MFCSKCGKQVKENSKFCQNCGSEVIANNIETAKPKGEYKSFALSKDTKLVGIHGWLAWFILGIFITAVLNIIGTLVDFTGWGLIDLAVGVYGLYVGFLLAKIKPGAVKHAKIYLVINVLLGVFLLIEYYSNSLNYEEEFLTTAWRIIVYGSIWFLYFSVSKRVKATYTNLPIN